MPSKFKLWIKNKWYIVVMGVLAIVGIVLHRIQPNLYQRLMSKYNDLIKRNQKELEEANKIRVEEKKKLQEKERAYKEELLRLEKEHAKLLDRLDVKKREKFQEIVSKTSNDPEAMAKELNKFFGIPIRDTSNNNSNG